MHAAFVCLLFAGVGQDQKSADLIQAMQGRWVIAEFGYGRRASEQVAGKEMLIDGTAAKHESGETNFTFSVDATKCPVHIDVYAPKPKKGPSVGTPRLLGVMSLEEDRLTIRCSGDRPKSIDEDRGYYLVLVRKTEKTEHAKSVPQTGPTLPRTSLAKQPRQR